MNEKFIKVMRKLLNTAYDALKDGEKYGSCFVVSLEDDLSLAVTYSEEKQSVVAKIGYNYTPVYCDYYLDFYSPTLVDGGDNYCTEIVITGKQLRKDAEWFYKQCKKIIRGRDHGLITEWRPYV